MILDDKTKTPYLHVLTNRMMRQGRLFNAPRRIHEFVKEFSSKHQGLFQKVLHLFEKVLSSVSCTIIIFLERTQKRRKNPLYAFMLLFPFMPVSTLSANLRLHLGGTRTMKTGYVCLLLGLGFYFLFGRLRATGLLENHTTRQNLFYIHIIQMLSVQHLPPKRIPLSVPPYNRLPPAILPYRYNH